MVSVLPATAAVAVRTVTVAATWLAEAVLLAGEPAAEAAVIPPAAAKAATAMPAMMIFGFRMVLS
jgi:hypothetical protein